MSRLRVHLFVMAGSALVAAVAAQQSTAAYEIAFTWSRDGQPGIYRMHDDGSDIRLVVAETNSILQPGFWSPDGRTVAHLELGDGVGQMPQEYPAPMHFPLYVVSPDGTGHRRVIDVPVEPQIAWSPDSTRIAFSSAFDDPKLGDPRILKGQEPHSSAIYVAEVDTGRMTRLSAHGNNRWPAWSPDGRRVVFSGSAPGASKPDLYVVDADGGRSPVRLVSTEHVNVQPRWSLARDLILFVGAPRGPIDSTNGVFVVRPDGSGVQRVAPGMAQSASWSPDGRSVLVAFSLNRIVDLATGATKDVGPGLDPAFTPDGRSVILRTLEGRAGALHVVKVADGSRRTIAENAAGAILFAVSPLQSARE